MNRIRAGQGGRESRAARCFAEKNVSTCTGGGIYRVPVPSDFRRKIRNNNNLSRSAMARENKNAGNERLNCPLNCRIRYRDPGRRVAKFIAVSLSVKSGNLAVYFRGTFVKRSIDGQFFFVS